MGGGRVDGRGGGDGVEPGCGCVCVWGVGGVRGWVVDADGACSPSFISCCWLLTLPLPGERERSGSRRASSAERSIARSWALTSLARGTQSCDLPTVTGRASSAGAESDTRMVGGDGSGSLVGIASSPATRVAPSVTASPLCHSWTHGRTAAGSVTPGA